MVATMAEIGAAIRVITKPFLSNMTETERYADERLSEWSRWARDYADRHAWPAWTLLARMISQGFGAGQPGRPPIAMTDDVADVDRIVARLPDMLRKTLIVAYMTSDPAEVKARRLRMSRPSFYRKLRKAQRQVYSELAILA